jgi:hypothetical protein
VKNLKNGRGSQYFQPFLRFFHSFKGWKTKHAVNAELPKRISSSTKTPQRRMDYAEHVKIAAKSNTRFGVKPISENVSQANRKIKIGGKGL